MGVYKAAAALIISLFMVTSLIGHHTGRLREVPVVGPQWEDLTTRFVSWFYDATGIYLDALGFVNEKVIDNIPLETYDMDLNKPAYAYPYWSYTGFPREKLPEILRSKVVQEFLDSVISEAEERIEKKDVPRDAYVLYLRATAYEVMVERAKYCAGGPTKDPRYVVTHCGDCDDWHVVAYALISKINEQYGIKARYFLTHVPGHAFLTVYYPEEGKWEIYDWFPPIGIPAFNTSAIKLGYAGYMMPDRKNVVLNGRCPVAFNVPKEDCVFKIRRFENFGRMYEFYRIYGEGEIERFYELPSLKYVEGSKLRSMWG
ncbi:hypothetical protein A3L09_00330 [Thermococcus profundus]|uniref:Transglutaminase-like domain-containing protein n=1 Tax=Thermococcus profundus TaxID=49899 RepID=A0A2Z2MCX8_THEPR|nr:hypothetical protein [Thermococcus profundus]ASJ01814.1 hypothetical protein A3L09_00330 [Thermococcus profundus]